MEPANVSVPAGVVVPPKRSHPRTIGWIGTSAMAMGGSNQSLFLITVLFVGQEDILGQGSAAVPLLILGLLLSWAAAPGWLELVLMYPNRVGGIAATCAEAFKPYSPILANLTGVCYWWGWVPTCGLTALFSAEAIHEWCLPNIPVKALACGLVLFFVLVNLCGVVWAARLAIIIAAVSAVLAFISSLAPILAGKVDWQQACNFHLTLPFSGWFGALTSAMAGLYLIGFAAPAFEAVTCHVGEMIDPEKNMPRAMLASGLMAGVYFLVLPVVWLGTLGSTEMGKELIHVLGPTFAPVFGSAAKSAAIWFMMFNMFHGTLQPLAGAARTLSQLAEDGLLPEFFSLRSATDAPWVTTVLTAGVAISFLLIGDPIWLLASANFTYLIGICLPNVAVWLLRRDQPDLRRPFRAPRGVIGLGLVAASIWGLSAILGFQQYGLPTVLISMVFAYSGSILYAWRKFTDRLKAGLPGFSHSLHIKLTGAMMLVLALDGIGYFIAVQNLGPVNPTKLAVLEDIFVAVAILTISVGLILPGMIAHSAVEVSAAAKRLVAGTALDFSRAMQALGRGDLDAAYARIDMAPVTINSRDEMGEMAKSFNELQNEIARGADGLSGAREGLRKARDQLTEINQNLEQRLKELAASLIERERVEIQLRQAKEAAESAGRAKSEFLAVMSHEIRTPMNGVLGFADILRETPLNSEQREYIETIYRSGEALLVIINDVLDLAKIEAGTFNIENRPFDLKRCVNDAITLCAPPLDSNVRLEAVFDQAMPAWVYGDRSRLRQVLVNLLGNAVKFTNEGTVTFRIRREAIAAEMDSKNHKLLFSIADTGIGIPASQITRLFRPFTQLDSSSTRKHGGTGLGLAISKHLVELMGGEIWAESEMGRGSTFTFRLSVHEAPASAVQPVRADTPSAKSMKILVVEDIKENLVLTLHMLADLGYGADAVGNGRECLEIIQRKKFDLIFMDLHMPEMDGFTATREIRRHENVRGDGSRIYICALTANVMPRDREACFLAGMDKVVAKPVRPEDLIAALSEVQDVSSQ